MTGGLLPTGFGPIQYGSAGDRPVALLLHANQHPPLHPSQVCIGRERAHAVARPAVDSVGV